jgi:hypothetical protein
MLYRLHLSAIPHRITTPEYKYPLGRPAGIPGLRSVQLENSWQAWFPRGRQNCTGMKEEG